MTKINNNNNRGAQIRQEAERRRKQASSQWKDSSTLDKVRKVSTNLAIITTTLSVVDIAVGTYNTTNDLHRVGWSRALGTGNSKFDMMTQCLINRECFTKFLRQEQRRTHPWLWAVAITALFASSAASQSGRPKLKEDLPGYARFAMLTDAPLQKYIKPFPDSKGNDMRRGYLGMLEDGTIMKAPMFLRCSHACIMGGPGARKSSGYHKPNMVMDALEGSTSVVIDLKFPDARGGFFDMAPAFHALGRSIQVFTPFTENTMRLNLLESAVNIDQALELAAMIIPPDDGPGAFYRNIERTVLGALLLAIAVSDKPSMREVYRKIIAGPSALKEFILKHPDDTVRETAAAMLEIKVDQLTGIIASLQNQLAIFNSKALARATTPKVGQNLNLRQCFREPTLLYVGINQGDLRGNGQTLLQLVKRTIDQAMFDVSRENGGALKIHTVFYLDEFANLGPLPNIQKDFATMRSYNVSYQVTLQNRAQGEELYGTAGFKSFFENNLQFQIVFPAFLKMSDAELYSNNMGYASYIETGQSESEAKNPFNRAGSGTRSRSTKISKKLLVTPDEMQDWAQEVAIIFMIGVRPIKAFMPRLDEATINITDSKGRKRPLKNPLHRYWNELGLGTNPQEFMDEFLGARGANDDDSENKGEFNPISAEERFKSWVMNLISYGAYVSPYRTQGRVIVFHKDLPRELAEPDDLAEFAEKGWINPEVDRFKIVRKGAEVLGMSSIFAALCDLEFNGGVRLWIQKHAEGLIGHPAAGNLREDDLDDPLGYYEEEAVALTKEALKEIFRNDIPEERLLPYRTKHKGRYYYRIPLSSPQALLSLYGRDEVDQGKPLGINKDIAPKYSPGSERDMEEKLSPHPAEATPEQVEQARKASKEGGRNSPDEKWEHPQEKKENKPTRTARPDAPANNNQTANKPRKAGLGKR